MQNGFYSGRWKRKLGLTVFTPPNMADKRVVVTVRISATRSRFRMNLRQGERFLDSRDNGVDSLGSSSGPPMLSGSRRGRNPCSSCCSGKVL